MEHTLDTTGQTDRMEHTGITGPQVNALTFLVDRISDITALHKTLPHSLTHTHTHTLTLTHSLTHTHTHTPVLRSGGPCHTNLQWSPQTLRR